MSVTSASTATARPPAATTPAAVSSAAAASMSTATTAAPSSATICAVSRPKPLPAPVMTTTLPCTWFPVAVHADPFGSSLAVSGGGPEDGLIEVRLHDIGILEPGLGQIGVAEVRPAELGEAEVGPAQSGAPEVGPPQVGLAQVRPLEVGPLQVGVHPEGVEAYRMPQVAPFQVAPAHGVEQIGVDRRPVRRLDREVGIGEHRRRAQAQPAQDRWQPAPYVVGRESVLQLAGQALVVDRFGINPFDRPERQEIGTGGNQGHHADAQRPRVGPGPAPAEGTPFRPAERLLGQSEEGDARSNRPGQQGNVEPRRVPVMAGKVGAAQSARSSAARGPRPGPSRTGSATATAGCATRGAGAGASAPGR